MQWPAVSTTSGATSVPLHEPPAAITATTSFHLSAGTLVPPTTGAGCAFAGARAANEITRDETRHTRVRDIGAAKSNRETTTRSHDHASLRARVRPDLGSASGSQAAVSYTHLTLPTNREV